MFFIGLKLQKDLYRSIAEKKIAHVKSGDHHPCKCQQKMFGPKSEITFNQPGQWGIGRFFIV